jgi:hypothetical protein
MTDIRQQEAPLSDLEPIQFRPRTADHGGGQPTAPVALGANQVAFDRKELTQILTVYGRMVAAGEWRDYAIDLGRETAAFSVFRRSSEVPLYRIEKTPRLARKQGAYSVVSATGHILKRGPDLRRVLAVFDSGLRLVEH